MGGGLTPQTSLPTPLVKSLCRLQPNLR